MSPVSPSGKPTLIVMAFLTNPGGADAAAEALVEAVTGRAIKGTGALATYDLDQPINLGIDRELDSLDLGETADAIRSTREGGH